MFKNGKHSSYRPACKAGHPFPYKYGEHCGSQFPHQPAIWFQRPGKKLVCVSSYHQKRKLIELTHVSCSLVPTSRKEVSVCLELPSQEKVNQTYIFITSTKFAISRYRILAAEYATLRALVRFSTPVVEWTVVGWTVLAMANLSAELGARRNVRSLTVPGRTVRGENLPRLDRGPAERGHREGGERLTEIDEIQRERG